MRMTMVCLLVVSAVVRGDIMGNLAKPSLESWAKSDDVEVAATARLLLQPIKAYESARRMHTAWKDKSREIPVLQTSPERPVKRSD